MFSETPETDPVDLTFERLQGYLASRAALFDPKKVNPKVIHVGFTCQRSLAHSPTQIPTQGSPVQSSDTVYFSGTCFESLSCSEWTHIRHSHRSVGKCVQLHPEYLYWCVCHLFGKSLG